MSGAIVVIPLAMIVPFLAALSDHRRANTSYMPLEPAMGMLAMLTSMLTIMPVCQGHSLMEKLLFSLF